jgi:hypothetical protein
VLTLPRAIADRIVPLAELFSERVFEHAETLVAGAILAPGKRTVTSVQRVGKSFDAHFQTSHRVLCRDRWSPVGAGRRLLSLLVERFSPDGPLVFGLDETIERRRGGQISAKGTYRDPVRTSPSHVVNRR